MIPAGQEVLWNRIQNFQLDDPEAVVKFSDKLASHNYWQPEYTARVIEEYKKFIFLCCISKNGASPSQAVDEAWHLHLTYTQNYWKEFCANVLGQDIHHNPSKGGQQEKHYHLDWYSQTLDLYRETFDEYPPADIWPAPPASKANISTVLLPVHSDMEVIGDYSKYFLFLLAPFLVPVIFNKVNPYHLTGLQFLLFYAVLIIACTVCLYFITQHNISVVTKTVGTHFDQTANIFQLTRYAYGRNRSLQAGLVDLVERQVLIPERKNLFTFSPSKYRYSTDEKNPFISNLLKQYKDNDRISYKNMLLTFDASTTEHPGLADLFNRLSKKDILKYFVAVFAIFIGVIRIAQGMENNRPVGYLIMMMVGAGFILFFQYRATGYKHIFRNILRNRFQNEELGAGFTTSSMMNQFAFMGVAVLGTNYIYNNLQNTFQRNYATGDGGANYSSCGSSGDSSCGSSCGGGSCGGCGGGGD